MADDRTREPATVVARRGAIDARSNDRTDRRRQRWVAPFAGPGAVRPQGTRNAIAGGVLLAWSALAALVVSFRPGSNALDRFVQSLVGFTPHSQPLLDLTKLGTRPLLVVGAAGAAAVVAPRDRKRAAACLLGPFLGAVTVEWVMKPLVGRHYAGVPTFPSGTVTVTAAVATAWVLAVPRRLQPAVMGAAAAAVAAVSYAVVALRWHYPTDAMVGVTFAVGTVLLVDGVLHLVAGGRGRSRQRFSS